jgi:hypothetical protein
MEIVYCPICNDPISLFKGDHVTNPTIIVSILDARNATNKKSFLLHTGCFYQKIQPVLDGKKT